MLRSFLWLPFIPALKPQGYQDLCTGYQLHGRTTSQLYSEDDGSFSLGFESRRFCLLPECPIILRRITFSLIDNTHGSSHLCDAFLQCSEAKGRQGLTGWAQEVRNISFLNVVQMVLNGFISNWKHSLIRWELLRFLKVFSLAPRLNWRYSSTSSI